MRQKQVWRFYCDHCKKSRGSRRGIEHHERHCANNPNRECRHCEMVGERQEPIHERCEVMIEDGFHALRDLVGNCPMCLLNTALIVNRHSTYESHVSVGDFDFQTEMKRFWQHIQSIRRDDMGCC
jgi:hypothetical protein